MRMRLGSMMEQMILSRVNESTHMNPTQHSPVLFGVENFDRNTGEHTVHEVLVNHARKHCTCSCGIPQLEGLVCSHVIAVCRKINIEHYDYCHDFYLMEAFRRTYREVLPVILDRRYWPSVRGPILLPPDEVRRPAGWPTKKRNTTEMDPQGRKGNTCSHCKVRGHTIRTCAEYRVIQLPPPNEL